MKKTFKKILMLIAISLIFSSCNSNKETEIKEEKIDKIESKETALEQEENEEEQINEDFKKSKLVEVSYPSIGIHTNDKNEYRNKPSVDLVGFAYSNPRWTELSDEDFESYVKFVEDLLKDKEFYLEEKYSYPSEIYYVQGFIWLELPEDPYNPTIEDVLNKSLNGLVVKEGYMQVNKDDEFNDFEEEFIKIEEENFDKGNIKRWNRMAEIGKNPETGEIIKKD